MKYSDKQYAGVLARISLFDINRREAHAILSCDKNDADNKNQIERLTNAVRMISVETGMKIVFKRYFLSDVSNQFHLLPNKDECARSVIQQPPLDGSKAALLIILQDHASFADEGEGIWIDRKGRIWAGDNGSVLPSDSKAMTVNYLERFCSMLNRHGGNLKDNCLRTWFFVRDIDNNYSGVVSGRNEVFKTHDLTPQTNYIASTGIAGQIFDPSCLVAFNAFADTGIDKKQVKFLYGKTHLNPTYEYGVAFERATAIDYGDRRHVYISGTASIDNKGDIVAPHDIRAQTIRMLENIEVLLFEGECEWSDVAHTIVYLRDISDYQVVRRIMRERLPEIPMVIVHAPVCRPGWLIEAECMAVKFIDNKKYETF